MKSFEFGGYCSTAVFTMIIKLTTWRAVLFHWGVLASSGDWSRDWKSGEFTNAFIAGHYLELTDTDECAIQQCHPNSWFDQFTGIDHLHVRSFRGAAFIFPRKIISSVDLSKIFSINAMQFSMKFFSWNWSLMTQILSNISAISEQFQWNFGAISDQFWWKFRAILEQYQCNFRTISDEYLEQFSSNISAISLEFGYKTFNWLGY